MPLRGAAMGATWESDSAGPDGIYSRVHLFGSANIWNSRDSDKDMWYLISLKIRSCKHTICPPKSLGKAEWGSEMAQPWAEVRFHGRTETGRSLSLLWVELYPPTTTKRKGYAECDLVWKSSPRRYNWLGWGEAIWELGGPYFNMPGVFLRRQEPT